MTEQVTKSNAESGAEDVEILLDSPVIEEPVPGADNAPGAALPEPAAGTAGESGDPVEAAPASAPAPSEAPAGEPAGAQNGQGGQEETSPAPSGDSTLPEGASSPWPREDLPAATSGDVPAPASGGEPPAPTEPNGGDEDIPEDEKPMSLLEHLGELRRRLVKGFLAILIGFFACYGFAQQLFYYLSLPLLKVMPADSKFIYTGVAEGFFVDLKVSFVAGLFVACPILFYQIWAFIAPGLYEEEKRYILPLSFCSALFFIMGGVFCYFGVFPFAFDFFMSYSTGNIVAMLSIDEYLSFALKMMIAFGLVFEMPLFSFFLARMGIITAQKMRHVRQYAILAIFIIAAILTPPDVFSQLMMAGPMLVLYEISIWVAVLVGKKKAEHEEASAKKAEKPGEGA